MWGNKIDTRKMGGTSNMKITKSYRLNKITLEKIKTIERKLELNFQTEVIEYAIEKLYWELKDEDLHDK